MKRHFATYLLQLFLFLLLPTSAFASNLVSNSSFEDINEGVPNAWIKNVSTVTLTTSMKSYSGTISASLNKTNSTTGLIYLYQDVNIESGKYYSLTGYALKNSPNFSWVILRISWRDGATELSKTDSDSLTSDNSEFKEIQITSVKAPPQATKARIELTGNIIAENPENPVLFDSISFSQIPPPEPTPTPTLAPTRLPTVTRTLSSPVSRQPTPTRAMTLTKTPSVADRQKINPSTPGVDEGAVLGEETSPTELPSSQFVEQTEPTLPPKGKQTKVLGQQYLPSLLFVASGIAFIVCAILALYLKTDKFRSWREK